MTRNTDTGQNAAPARVAAPYLLPRADAVPPVETLRFRRDFLRAASALRKHAPGLLLQARARQWAGDGTGQGDGATPPGLIRVGFTCSKKIGNAVTRNRAKRRLRAAAQLVLARHGRPGWDYVLVGRPGATVSRDFAALCADLRGALATIHDETPRPPQRKGARG